VAEDPFTYLMMLIGTLALTGFLQRRLLLQGRECRRYGHRHGGELRLHHDVGGGADLVLFLRLISRPSMASRTIITYEAAHESPLVMPFRRCSRGPGRRRLGVLAHLRRQGRGILHGSLTFSRTITC
jgi:hypothetical protein